MRMFVYAKCTYYETNVRSGALFKIRADLSELFCFTVVVISPRALGCCLVSKFVCSDPKRQNWKSWLYLFTYCNDHHSAGICWEEYMTQELKISLVDGLHVSWRRLCKSKKAFALIWLMMSDQGKVSDRSVCTCKHCFCIKSVYTKKAALNSMKNWRQSKKSSASSQDRQATRSVWHTTENIQQICFNFWSLGENVSTSFALMSVFVIAQSWHTRKNFTATF